MRAKVKAKSAVRPTGKSVSGQNKSISKRSNALTAKELEELVKPKKRINSRKKGSRGELDLVHYLIDHGFDARRGQQFKGTPDSPDIISDMLTKAGLHIECKRVEAGNLYKWLNQAKRDAGLAVPVVMHRRSDERWVAILDLDDFLKFIHNNYDPNFTMFETRIVPNDNDK